MPTTVATAVEAVRERLDELDAAQWSDKQLRRWLDEAAKNIARETHILIDSDSITVTADTSEYTVPSDVLRLLHVYFTPTGDANRDIPIEPRDWQALDAVWGDRQNDFSSDYPRYYTIIGYSPNTTLKLWPVPSTGGTLTVYSARLPASIDVDLGGGDIDVPTGWEDVMYEYAEYMALRKDRDDRYQIAYQAYVEKLERLKEMGNQLNAPNEFIPSGAGGMVPNWIADPNW